MGVVGKCLVWVVVVWHGVLWYGVTCLSLTSLPCPPAQGEMGEVGPKGEMGLKGEKVHTQNHRFRNVLPSYTHLYICA